MVRVRLGPSPTGDPHVGTAYIALFNYAFAKKHGGQFVLRIEDTDQGRSQRGWETMIIAALRWLGLDWDEGPDVGGPLGPYRQSERGDIYRAHVAQLCAAGAAYPCFCTPARLDQLRAEQRRRGVAPGYDGRCRHLDADAARARARAGEAHVVRLRVPHEEQLRFVDGLRGELSFAGDQVDDQVLQKSDGLPTYHLANVVDDHLMQITHVIRAEEWITSTPKHVLLYRGFGWEPPTFIHMPLLRNPDKSKISKRKNPVSLNFYREAGYLPEAMRNYLAMMGWTMPDGREKFDLAAMVDSFDLGRISLGGPVFDVAKLTWLNGLYLRELSVDAFVDRILAGPLAAERLRAVVPLVQDRVEKLEDFAHQAAPLFAGEVTYDAAARVDMVPKARTPAETAAALTTTLTFVDAQPSLDEASLETSLRGQCEADGWKPKELFMAVRVAVTGRRATPPLFATLAVLGKEQVRRRLRAAIALLKD